MPGYIIHLAVGKVYCENNKKVGYKDGKLSIIDENSLYEFIETVGKIKLKEDIIKNINKYNFRKDKKENECEK